MKTNTKFTYDRMIAHQEKRLEEVARRLAAAVEGDSLRGIKVDLNVLTSGLPLLRDVLGELDVARKMKAENE